MLTRLKHEDAQRHISEMDAYEIVHIRSSNVSDTNTDDEYLSFSRWHSIGYGWAVEEENRSADIVRAKAGATRVDVKQTANVDTRPKDY